MGRGNIFAKSNVMVGWPGNVNVLIKKGNAGRLEADLVNKLLCV